VKLVSLSSDLRQKERQSEAIALYKGSGYVEVKAFNAEPYAHHWFEKTIGKKTQSGRVQ